MSGPLLNWDLFIQQLEQRMAKIEGLAKTYQNAKPFPHIFIDDFLPIEIANKLSDEFPLPHAPLWFRLPTEDQKYKTAASDEKQFPSSLRQAIQEFHSGFFVEFLEKLTGIENLIPDPKLVGGGLHQIKEGGKLSVHIDYSHHPNNGLNRRLNLLLYLNKDWHEEYGGHFELWDQKLSKCEVKVLPIFNRCVVFSTTDTSFHGHPDPLKCPADRTRNSVALYYYTLGRKEEKGQIIVHNTTFHSKPQESASLGTRLIRWALSDTFRDLVPPFCYRWLRAAWNRFMKLLR